MIQQHPREFFAGELRTLVGIEDLRLAEPGERFVECLDAEPRCQGVRQTPGQNPPGSLVCYSTGFADGTFSSLAQSMIATRYRNP